VDGELPLGLFIGGSRRSTSACFRLQAGLRGEGTQQVKESPNLALIIRISVKLIVILKSGSPFLV